MSGTIYKYTDDGDHHGHDNDDDNYKKGNRPFCIEPVIRYRTVTLARIEPVPQDAEVGILGH